MRYIAFITKGLEHVAREELERNISDIAITEIKDKRIVFESAFGVDVLSNVKTIDDIAVMIAQEQDICSTDDVRAILDKHDLRETFTTLSNIRPLSPTFSLTMSIVGNQKIRPKDLLTTLANQIEKKYPWEFTQLTHTNFDIRIFIDRKELYISVRLFPESLHQRTYKIESKSGSLKPPVAAAMVNLATNFTHGKKIIDLFCGSGTILCEARLAGHEVFGSDTDLESIEITKRNIKRTHLTSSPDIRVQNALHTNWPSGYFDCVISNLPWDKQIQVESITMLYEQAIQEIARIITPEGRVCLLITKPDLAKKYLKKFFPNKHIREIKIGLLGQTPTILGVF